MLLPYGLKDEPAGLVAAEVLGVSNAIWRLPFPFDFCAV